MTESPLRPDHPSRERARYYILYTGLFLVMAWVAFFCFIKNDRLFMWMPDSLNYYSNLKEMGTNPFFIDGFTFQRGLGRGFQELDVIKAVFYPVLLLAYIWPTDSFESLYTLRVLVACYLSGISFSALARKFTRCTPAVLAGAMTYIFTGYILLFGIRHPYFTETLVLFTPLIILGIEKILRQEGIYLLTVSVFLLALESIYFLCIATVLAALFFIIRFFTSDQLSDKRSFALFLRYTGQIIISYTIGALISSVTWLSSIQMYTQNGRIGRTVTENLLLYPQDEYEALISSFFSASRDILGFPAVAFFSLCSLFTKRKSARCLRWFWLIGTLCLCCPLFGYICSGFNNITSRWAIGYTLIVAMAVCSFLEGVGEVTWKQLAIWNGCLALYTGLCMAFGDGLPVYWGLGMLAVTLVVLLLLRMERMKKYAGAVLLVVTCVSLAVNSNMLYSCFGTDYQQSFLHKGTADYTYMGNSLEGLSMYLERNPDDSFFRVSANEVNTMSTNGSMAYDLNGLADFNSGELSYTAYLVENDNAGVQDITAKHGMDNRTAMMELAAVKYYSANSRDSYALPYGYYWVDQIEGSTGSYDIYVNQFALPIGYTYGSFITRQEYDAMDVLDRQNALMQAVLLEEPTDQIPHDTALSLTSVKNTILATEYDNVERDGNTLTVGAGGGYITYTIDPIPGELYVHITGHHLPDSYGKFYVDAYTDTTYAESFFRGDRNTYYASADRLLNLGYAEEPRTTVTLIFFNQGTYTLEDIEILTQPMDEYEAQASSLAEEALQNVEVQGNTITGDVTISGDKIMCFAIPYSTAAGWTAFVDGRETQIFQANSMYMGIALTPGYHTIRLEYRSPMLRECGILSVVSAAGFAAYWVLSEKKRRRTIGSVEA